MIIVGESDLSIQRPVIEGVRHICRGPTSRLVMMGVWLRVGNQMRSAHDRAVAAGAGGREGSAVCAAQHGRRLPPRVGERELSQVREAELRVRAAGSSWARAEVLVDQDRAGAWHRWPAAGG